MIKVVSFDIGGTILINKKEDNYTLLKLSELINKSYEETKITYKNIFQKEKGSLEELCQKFCTELNIPLNNQILDFFENKFNKSNNDIHLNPEIEEIIAELKKRNIKIILFSNSCCLINNAIPKTILKNIDYSFYSYDYGYTKEDKELYNIIENKMNCNPNEILHIGDTLKSDYIYPKKYGWNALYYGEIHDKTIQSINNLLDINKCIDNIER